MNGRCDQFLASAGLATDQDRGLAGGDAADPRVDRAHRPRVANDILRPEALFEGVAETQVFGLQGFMLMRGDRDKLYGVVTSPEWQRIVTRAGFIVQDFGAVRALLDDEAVRWVEAMEEVTADLV